MSQQDDSQNSNKYAIKYSANEIFLTEGKCLNPGNCTCNNLDPSYKRCYASLEEIKQEVEDYYKFAYFTVKDMTHEQFKKEFLRK